MKAQATREITAKPGAPVIEAIETGAYKIPTDRPESDGTFEWRSTTMVTVKIRAGGVVGFGYSYADSAIRSIIDGLLAPAIKGLDALDIPACWARLNHAVRNNGYSGPSMMAIAAVDSALWDLKGRLLNLPVARLLGLARDKVPVYGSGGFTSYTIDELEEQLSGWVGQGIGMVKMKVGRDPNQDIKRVQAARRTIGDKPGLFIDANGGYDRKEALSLSEIFAAENVSWFEEPVDHRDLEGLRLMRDRAPSGMDISAGEYGFELGYFKRLLDSGAVDVLQADATRCGITGFIKASVLCESSFLPLSSHCAPSLHLHLCCALAPVRHLEYFHDHVRIEQMLFDGALSPVNGLLGPDMSRPGFGIELKEADARKFEI